MTPRDLRAIAVEAALALVDNRLITLQQATGGERPKGWPLPVKKHTGGLPQQYRPQAVLEWIADLVEREARSQARVAALQSAAQKDPAP